MLVFEEFSGLLAVLEGIRVQLFGLFLKFLWVCDLSADDLAICDTLFKLYELL